LQKVAPRSFAAFFQGEKRQQNSCECRAARASRFCNSGLQQGDSSFACRNQAAENKEGNIMSETLKTLNKDELHNFTGSEHWYRHPLNRKVLYTDGARHVAEAGGAYWLLDEIALIQPYEKAVAAQEFQVWKLTVKADRTATLTCEDGNFNEVFRKEIEFTDFPLDEITLWFANDVIYLPSEH
jgi:hypothetical protein